VRSVLIGAIGCNLAWAIVDAVMYLLYTLGERGWGLVALRSVRSADPEEGRRLIASAVPPVLASLIRPAEVESLRERLVALPEPPARPRLAGDDFLGAVAVFLLVFLSTFPVVVPFLLIGETATAVRASNAVAIAMLFLAGSAFGRSAGYRPWRMGLSMVAIGVVLVVITLALGG
jgi:VIT1/CCC1 family predicted Fe2+/Mn2+ transporter